jgi:hypothetical protein
MIFANQRTELADSLRQHYQSSNGKAKKLILSEFIASTGYHPKYALHLLNTEDAALPKRPQTRNRSSLYDDAARQALIVLWEASDRVCGKRLQPLLRILLPALERHGHLQLDEVVRSKVLTMSAATIDRRAMRHAPRRLAASLRRFAAACRCEPLPTGKSHFRAAWKWILSHIAEK